MSTDRQKARKAILEKAATLTSRGVYHSGGPLLDEIKGFDIFLLADVAEDLQDEGLLEISLTKASTHPIVRIKGLTKRGREEMKPWIARRWTGFRRKLDETIDNRLATVVLAGVGWALGRTLEWLLSLL